MNKLRYIKGEIRVDLKRLRENGNNIRDLKRSLDFQLTELKETILSAVRKEVSN